MKKTLMIIAIIGIMIIAGAMLYYFVFYIPSFNQEKLALQKQQYDMEQKEKQENKTALNNELKEIDDWYQEFKDMARAENISMTLEEHNLLWKMYQDKLADCYKRYGE